MIRFDDEGHEAIRFEVERFRGVLLVILMVAAVVGISSLYWYVRGREFEAQLTDTAIAQGQRGKELLAQYVPQGERALAVCAVTDTDFGRWLSSRVDATADIPDRLADRMLTEGG